MTKEELAELGFKDEPLTEELEKACIEEHIRFIEDFDNWLERSRQCDAFCEFTEECDNYGDFDRIPPC